MSRFPFITSQASLFYFTEGGVDEDGGQAPDFWRHSNCVYVERIEWPEVVQFVCQYCGASVAPGEKCPGCQNPHPIREGSVGTALVGLCGPIPQGLFIFNPPSKLAINYNCCGCWRDNFHEYDLRIEINMLRIVRRTMDKPMCFDPSGAEMVMLRVEIEADISMRYPEVAEGE